MIFALRRLAVETAPGGPSRLLPLRALHARFSLRSRVSPAGREVRLRGLEADDDEATCYLRVRYFTSPDAIQNDMYLTNLFLRPAIAGVGGLCLLIGGALSLLQLRTPGLSRLLPDDLVALERRMNRRAEAPDDPEAEALADATLARNR